MKPTMTLADFLAISATTLCFQPDNSPERALWLDTDGKYYTSESENEETVHESLEEALKALMRGE